MTPRIQALREYLRGALWALPAAAVVVAIGVGSALSRVSAPTGSVLHRLAFQGTVDDARTLLIGIAGTMITVIALVLGLTVVALQLASTQYSPRLLRDFLRDLPNQVVLASFVATFAYSSAGLYTVGVSAGAHTTDYPRLAVSGALVLLFLSLGALVFEVNHLSHSMQVDQIVRRVEHHTVHLIHRLPGTGPDGPDDGQLGEIPPGATAIIAPCSGYVQRVEPRHLLAAAAGGVNISVSVRLGDHVVAKATPLARLWRDDGVPVDQARLGEVVDGAIRIGFERTLEQDIGFGIRQLVDVASKALSPAVNDPYTAVQAVDHLSVVICALGGHRLGTQVICAERGRSGAQVTVPAASFADYLDLACAQVRRYGAGEPIVIRALLRLLQAAASVRDDGPSRSAVAHQVWLMQADAEREVRQSADLESVRAEASALLASLAPGQGAPSPA